RLRQGAHPAGGADLQGGGVPRGVPGRPPRLPAELAVRVGSRPGRGRLLEGQREDGRQRGARDRWSRQLDARRSEPRCERLREEQGHRRRLHRLHGRCRPAEGLGSRHLRGAGGRRRLRGPGAARRLPVPAPAQRRDRHGRQPARGRPVRRGGPGEPGGRLRLHLRRETCCGRDEGPADPADRAHGAMTTAVARPTATGGRRGRKIGGDHGRMAYLLLLPTLILLALVVGFPLVLSAWQSLMQSGQGVDPATGLIIKADTFGGLDTFVEACAGAGAGAGFWNAFWNPALFTVVGVSTETVLGVAMALIMAKAMRATGLVRASILIPWAIPPVVSALMWQLIFDAN